MPTPVVISQDRRLLEPVLNALPDDESTIMHRWLLTSSDVWVGMVRGELACIWGLVTPSLLSFETYIWLYHTKVAEANRFLVARKSQLIIERILEEYPVIYGHVKADATESKRWLGWLGATLGEPLPNGFRRFEIRKRNG